MERAGVVAFVELPLDTETSVAVLSLLRCSKLLLRDDVALAKLLSNGATICCGISVDDEFIPLMTVVVVDDVLMVPLLLFAVTVNVELAVVGADDVIIAIDVVDVVVVVGVVPVTLIEFAAIFTGIIDATAALSEDVLFTSLPFVASLPLVTVVELMGTVKVVLLEASRCDPVGVLIAGTEELLLLKFCKELLLLLFNAFNCSATSLLDVANREECIITAPPLPMPLLLPDMAPADNGNVDANVTPTPEADGIVATVPPFAAAFIMDAIARIGFCVAWEPVVLAPNTACVPVDN